MTRLPSTEMHLAHYIRLAQGAQTELCRAWTSLSEDHSEELDVQLVGRQFATACGAHAEVLAGLLTADATDADPTEDFGTWPFRGTRSGSLGLLRDLHEIYLMVTEGDVLWTFLEVGAQGTRDGQLLQLTDAALAETKKQLAWLRSRMKQAAPQALLVAE